MEHPEILPHLFRTEYRKIVSVLTRRFGFDQMEIAEDIASETFLSAAQTWPLNGLPPSPVGWLYNVAKNKAKNYLHHNAIFEDKVSAEIKIALDGNNETEIDLSPQNINDSQLQMMFAICHPAIPTEAQIGLSLRILCGFGIDEIATAFLTNKETINKRLFRAKEKLRQVKVHVELPGPAAIDERLETVLRTIYLLFNEGYHSASNHSALRKELCFEAMRLCCMLVENKDTNRPEVNALLSLMCFHASRFDARVNEEGDLILYEEQDTNLWNTELISKGGYFLNCSAAGDRISKYHLEASIAYWNTQRTDTKEKWENVLKLTNHLLQIEYSPIAAMNRIYAISKIEGKNEAILEAEKLNLPNNHFYHTLLGELYSNIDHKKARDHFQTALTFVRTEPDKLAIQKKLSML